MQRLTSRPVQRVKPDDSPASCFIAVTWQLLPQRLQLRKLSCRSEWPLILLWIFLFHRYYRVKSMHMISTMDFFFISCIKWHSVCVGGSRGLPARSTPPKTTPSSSTGGIWQLELIRAVLSLSICWLRFSRQLYRWGDINESFAEGVFIMFVSKWAQHLSLSITRW